MKRNFYRSLHVALPILIGLDLLNINRTLSFIGGIALMVSFFTLRTPQRPIHPLQDHAGAWHCDSFVHLSY